LRSCPLIYVNVIDLQRSRYAQLDLSAPEFQFAIAMRRITIHRSERLSRSKSVTVAGMQPAFCWGLQVLFSAQYRLRP